MRRAFCLSLCLLLLPLPAFASFAPEGLLAWTTQLGGEGITIPGAMALASGGGVFVAGETDGETGGFGPGYGQRDGFVLRLDDGGRALWQGRYGGGGDDLFTHVLATMDGGCVAMGFSDSADGHTRAPRGAIDAFLVRLDADGETIWTKNLGGSQDDELLDIVETAQGQFLVCGRSRSYNGDLGVNRGGWDAWVALLSAEDGRPQWSDSYGDQGDDMYNKIVPAPDSGWLLIGEQQALAANGDAAPAYESKPFVMLYGANGKKLWPEPMILGESGMNRILAAIETDTGWLLLGETDSRSAMMPNALGGEDIWVLNISSGGQVQWQRRFGGSKDDAAYSVASLPSGGYVILGMTESGDGHVTGSHGSRDLWVLSIAQSGQLQWQQTLGGGEDSRPAGLIPLAGGAFLVAGATTAQDGDIGRHVSVRTGFLCFLSSNGNLLDTQLVGGSAECKLLDVAADENGAYLLGTLRGLRDGAFVEDLFVAKLDEGVGGR